MSRFANREAAGLELARSLRSITPDGAVVLGIPNGGVPVAAAIARTLGAPLDVLDVHEVTGHRADLGLGAVDSAGADTTRRSTATALGVSGEELDRAVADQRSRLQTLLDRVRRAHPLEDLDGRTAVVVDDALAVAAAVTAAAVDAKQRGARRTILAVPVAVDAFAADARDLFDDVTALETVTGHLEITDWYEDLPPVSDDDVVELVTATNG